MAACVVFRAGRVLVVRAPAGARWWAGLWHFPCAEVEDAETPGAAAARAAAAALGRCVREGAPMLRLRHAVTRHQITLHVLGVSLADAAAGGARASGRGWRRPAELERLAMPAPHRRVARELLRLPREGAARRA